MKFKDLLKQNKRDIIRKGCALALSGGFGLWTFGKFIGYIKHKKMDRICQRKRQATIEAINNYKLNHQPCQLSQELQKQILNGNVAQIKQLLYEEKMTVFQTVLVFIERILKVACSDNLNIITEINFDEALEEAKIQDQEIKQDKNIINKYPLFGIPVSVKETFIQKNFDSTYGLGANCFQPAQEDGIQVAQIRQARGIIIARTNVPQVAMTFESVNHVYGRTKNPWNPNRAVGGSSGGEGALAAARGSVLGIGSDVGGSIRIPAAFCGVYGFKPYSGRIPDYGEAKISLAVEGVTELKVSRGPIARCVDDLIVLTKVLFDKEIYSKIPMQIKDPYFEPQELNDFPKKQKLRVGYFDIFNGLVTPFCMSRAVKETCQALESQGHEIVEFKVDQQLQSIIANCFLKIVAADGGMKSYIEALHGQKFIEEYELLVQDANICLGIKKFVLAPLFKLFGQKTLLEYNNNTKVDVYQYLVDSAIRKQTNFQFCQAIVNQGIDVIICPAFGQPAVKHGGSKQLAFTALYTWIWNVVDFPVGCLPITTVQNDQDLEIKGQQNSMDLVYRFMKRDLQGAIGLPVNVQVAALPNQDEMVLRVMKEIEAAVKFNSQHPYPELN
ncbi:unnamed protein product (macronuclear) [Paramecium tetraurelia]|uniref:Amidase domain-containing protein n=1 Tax=Paramecium tetraurelia TaxID=5888 RepID=A0DRL1_PARTE|nr:uncharacterized protein GSPATT00019396001 [Paramecium tetraurelia]CAK85678.1 unnamed protein product [Paramecium tetraurelia]|eukprot:XP_001453075.1 hypothetical protein (macronuclear) [Paramecium tetraurelia strain d4-2]